VVARNEEQVVEVAARLRHDGHEAFAFRCDATNPRDVREVAMAAREAMGRVDILVNNAGTVSSNPLKRVRLEEWNHLLAVNATGTYLFTRALLPDMVERGWGRVVNVASLAGLRGTPYTSAYTASKHAVVGFTRAVAAEVLGTGVTVNALCPGYVNTPLTQETVAHIVERTGRSYQDALGLLLQQFGQYRLIPPTEVAEAILKLCRQEAADVNGEAIPMDGGGLEL
jgi:NAD(P)-dependent dehydrogenase (short-subunit alcohol dehydrogenase family)